MSGRAAACAARPRRPLAARLATSLAVVAATSLALPAAPAAAEEGPITWSSSPGRLVLTADAGHGALDVLLDDQLLTRLVHAGAVSVQVRYGNGRSPRVDRAVDGRGCTQVRASLEGAAAVSVWAAGAPVAVLEDVRHSDLRMKLC